MQHVPEANSARETDNMIENSTREEAIFGQHNK
jgi:hypothetical protein